jgi:hypothetical protein
LCKTCAPIVNINISQLARIIMESINIVNTSKNLDTQLSRCNVIISRAQGLLSYEIRNIPTIKPHPADLINEFNNKRELLIHSSVEHDLGATLDKIPSTKSPKVTINQLNKILLKIHKYKSQLKTPSLLDQLQEKVSNKIKELTSKAVFEISDNLLSIDSSDFMGFYNKSADGKYIVAFQDRFSSPGKVVLIHNDRILYFIVMERPNDAFVSNDGTVAVNDWLFTDDLAGAFYVVSPEGRILIKHKVEANLNHCGITADGQIAWCNTCTSDCQPDSDKLLVFSAPKASLIAKIEGRVDPEEIIANEQEVSIKIRGYYERYDYNGNLLNAEEAQDAYYSYLLTTSPYELIKIVRSILRDSDLPRLSDQQFRIVRSILLKIINEQNLDNSYKAQAHRFLGDLSHSIEDIESTIVHYRNALSLDPKVGIKTTLAKLEKQFLKSI